MAFRHISTKLVLFGWTGFIAENLILSHNRKEIIESIGDDNYHRIYNTLSTIACGSIAYGFLRYRTTGPLISKHYPKLYNIMSSKAMKYSALGVRIVGLVGFSQLFPKLQIPFMYQPMPLVEGNVQNQIAKPKLVARCPMDFSSAKDQDAIQGWKRVTRHPALMSFGLTFFSFAMTTPYVASGIMFTMPLVFSFIGGAHQDYRFRRGNGGVLEKNVDESTSLIPFVALVTGKQRWNDLWKEFKVINASLAATIALLLL